jgi:hypothetical protein
MVQTNLARNMGRSMAVATQKITIWSVLGSLIIPVAMVGNAIWQFEGGPGIGIGWWLLFLFVVAMLMFVARPRRMEAKSLPEEVECLNCGRKLAGTDPRCSSCGWSWESDTNESA